MSDSDVSSAEFAAGAVLPFLACQLSGSVDALKELGKGLVLLGATLLPWLPLALLGFVGFQWARQKQEELRFGSHEETKVQFDAHC